MSRKVGSNFDGKKANEIFDNLNNLKENKSLDKLKNDIKLTKDISQMLKQAKSSDDDAAVEIYKKVLAMEPENYEAYVGLIQIYQKNNDMENEKKILKNAIKNLKGSKKEALAERLKQINH